MGPSSATGTVSPPWTRFRSANGRSSAASALGAPSAGSRSSPLLRRRQQPASSQPSSAARATPRRPRAGRCSAAHRRAGRPSPHVPEPSATVTASSDAAPFRTAVGPFRRIRPPLPRSSCPAAREMPASISVRALGTTAVAAVTDAGALLGTRAILVRELRALDLACSRFRPDSELQLLNESRGDPRRSQPAPLERARGGARGGAPDRRPRRSDRRARDAPRRLRPHLRAGPAPRRRARAGAVRRRLGAGRRSSSIRSAGRRAFPPASSSTSARPPRRSPPTGSPRWPRRPPAPARSSRSAGTSLSPARLPPAAGWWRSTTTTRPRPEATRARVAVEAGGLASSGIRVRRWRTAAGRAPPHPRPAHRAPGARRRGRP